MTDGFAFFHQQLGAIASSNFALTPAADSFTTERPKNPRHGDFSTNLALVLAKQVRRPALEIAGSLAGGLKQLKDVTRVDVVAPGFVNWRVETGFWSRFLHRLCTEPDVALAFDLGQGRGMNIEYVSANPTGPLHVGHGRGAVVGDVLARLLARAGFRVVKEYYVNDQGSQIDYLAESLQFRYRQLCAGLEPSAEDELPDHCYPGLYLVPVARQLLARHGRTLPDQKPVHTLFRQAAVAAMLDLIKSDLQALGVKHDVFTRETDLGDRFVNILDMLKQKDLIYEGIPERPLGDDSHWQPRKQPLFRSTAFGDDQDRPLRKSDGSWTYFAADIVYHADKLSRSAYIIDVLGADHAGYLARLSAICQALGGQPGRIHFAVCQLVHFEEQGQAVKMSKRSGRLVYLRDLIQAVGADAVRYFMLTRKPEAGLKFDLAEVTRKTRDNPIYYIQYAHSRCCALQRQMAAQNLSLVLPADITTLTSRLVEPQFIEMIAMLANWTKLLRQAAAAREPHRLTSALHDLAAKWHAIWQLGHRQPELRFVRAAHPETTAARLTLALGVQLVLADGLKLMGITPSEYL